MNKLYIFLILALLAVSGGNLSGQSYKFGYINSSELMQAMPDIDSVQKKMEAYGKDLELVIEEMQVEVNKKVDAYQKGEAGWTDAVKTAKQTEINDMQRRVQEKMESSQNEYNEESQKLMMPILTKARNAITKVGKDNGFTYIFDTSAGALPYMNEAQAINVLDLVKKELGITK
ncbi:MAG: OmpH family outer membrane protein [Prevotellaceae bacterium]|jgi:outer membrane protein|nr:OmpH family outer membrane protein [Prevotellaceae bacterium]